MTDEEIIQANIKRLMTDKCFTNEHVASITGLSRNTISRARGFGDNVRTMSSIIKIAQALEVTLLDLVTPHETTPALQDLKRAALQAGEGSVFTQEVAFDALKIVSGEKIGCTNRSVITCPHCGDESSDSMNHLDESTDRHDDEECDACGEAFSWRAYWTVTFSSGPAGQADELGE